MASRMCDRLLGVRVLLVEPRGDHRHVLRRRLQGEGATVFEAPAGREALQVAETEAFDIALIGLGLPDMSDEDLIGALSRVSGGATAVAVITASPRQDLARAIAAGAQRVFAGPVDYDELLRYLERNAPPTRPPAKTQDGGRAGLP